MLLKWLKNYIMKFLMNIVLYSCNMKCLLIYQVYVNESMATSALVSRLSPEAD